jgi:hypothetical protein
MFISFSSKSQNICAFSYEQLNTVNCLNGYVNYTDNINASVVVEDMLFKMKIKNSFFVTKVCKGVNNAIAIKYNGIKYILLDVEWMETLKSGKNDWFHVFVIGHEISHHLLGHTDTKTSSLQISRQHELEADELSGYLLGNYGIAQNEINSLLDNFPDEKIKNSTHPEKKDRILAIQKGYNSSKKSEINVLLQSITKSADFNLTNLPFLLSEARNSWNKYLQYNSNKDLDIAIDYYQQAIRFHEDPQLTYELGELFLAKGDRKKYYSALELTYKKTNYFEYLNELINGLIESEDINLPSYLKKYKLNIDAVNIKTLNDVRQVVYLTKYYMYLSRVNFEKNGIDYTKLDKAVNSARFGLELISKKQTFDTKDYDLRGESYNALGLCYLWKEDYKNALANFKKAKIDFQNGLNNGSITLENTFKYYSLNNLVVTSNIALTCVRLRNWQEGLNSSIEYENFVNTLSQEKLDYLNKIGVIKFDDVFYYKARCLHGLEDFENSIKYYSLAISKVEDKSGFLYFYRALSYLGLNKTKEACSDFNFACKEGIQDACSRYSSTCN